MRLEVTHPRWVQTEESEAVRALKSGDIGALETLVRLHQLHATRVAYLVTQDPTLAEDVVQGAFIKAFERANQFDQGKPFWPWFARVVINDAIKATQQSRRFVPLEGNTDENPDARMDMAPRADASPTPEQMTELKDRNSAVWEALRTLRSEQRAVVVLYYYLDLSVVEIARILGLKLGTVKWRLHRARSVLKGAIGPQP